MGNPLDGGDATSSCDAPIHTFYSAKTWIEGKAVEQLYQVSCLEGVCEIAAFPDLHPGKFGPVGCAILADRIFPQLIGNDIGCGMSVFALEMPKRKLKMSRLDEKLYRLDDDWSENARVFFDRYEMDFGQHPHSMGTIGGGNHFCELQEVTETSKLPQDSDVELCKGMLLLMVHSGSSAFGYEIFSNISPDKFAGMKAGEPATIAYLEKHDLALRWASLNRLAIAERVADILRTSIRLVVDNPHNLVEQHGNCFLHRKGAAKADMSIVPLAGSRDAPSYLVAPTGTNPKSLNSLAHGAGRKFDRKSMLGRTGKTRSEREALSRNADGGPIICHDRQSLIEEAPMAYKDPKLVLEDMQAKNLLRHVATMRPLLTYKKRPQVLEKQRDAKHDRRSQRRRER
ncbi:MAG: RNA ligase RtcB family protein [Rhizobiaceae bacterium]|nr:RNA ligase RtcB family protein [Rhizobiaceae bacterium]